MATTFYDVHNPNFSVWRNDFGIPHHVSTFTEFFRYPNIQGLALDAQAGLIPKDNDGVVQIAEPACSLGKETWSLAAALALRKVDFRIDASDISPNVLDIAQGHFRVCRDDITVLEIAQATPFFHIQNGSLTPKDEIKDKVTFTESDLSRDPLEPQKYGAIMVNTLFGHYFRYNEATNRMIANIARGLMPGGGLYVSSALHERKSTLGDALREHNFVFEPNPSQHPCATYRKQV